RPWGVMNRQSVLASVHAHASGIDFSTRAGYTASGSRPSLSSLACSAFRWPVDILVMVKLWSGYISEDTADSRTWVVADGPYRAGEEASRATVPGRDSGTGRRRTQEQPRRRERRGRNARGQRPPGASSSDCVGGD